MMKTRFPYILAAGCSGLICLSAYAQTPEPQTPAQKNLISQPTEIPLTDEELHQQKVKERAQHIKDLAKAIAAGDASAEAEISRKRDSGLACEVAWIVFNQHLFTQAEALFSEALTWHPDELQAKQGLFYCYKNQGNDAAALPYLSSLPPDQQAINAPPKPAPPSTTTVPPSADLHPQPATTQNKKPYVAENRPDYTMKAVQLNKEKDYPGALAALAKEARIHSLNRGLRVMRAYIYFNENNFQQARQEFEELYREDPDQNSAEGLYYSAQRLNQLEQLRSDHALNQGPLASLLLKELAQEYYTKALYGFAYKLDYDLDPGLYHLDSPWAEGGAVYRNKEGSAGTSRLEEDLLPTAEGSWFVTPTDQIKVQVDRLELDSGHLADGVLYGTAPLVPTPRKYSAVTDYPNLILPRIDYLCDGITSWDFSLGTTPINSVISPLPVGKIEMVQQVDDSSFTIAAFSKSNTESLQSYAGVRDPYTGRVWGRVIETGLRSSGYLSLGSDWGLYASGGASELLGDNVQDNNHLFFSVNLGRNIKLPDFQYLTVGPTFEADHFAHNESFYTYGQGGYYSPDSMESGGLAVSFLTKESRRFLADGYASAGAQTNHQPGSPFLPLSGGDGRNYPGSSDSSIIFSTHFRLAYLLTEHWQANGFFSYSKSADYNEAEVGLFFRYYFDGRRALFRNDLPEVPDQY